LLLCKNGQLCVAQRVQLQLQQGNGGYFHCKLPVLSQNLGNNLGYFGVFLADFGLVL